MTLNNILLNPTIYHEPKTFNPDRWLHNPPPEKYFVPFSHGTRMCQGVRYAYAELYLAIAVLVRRFEFSLHETIRERDVDLTRDCFIGDTSLDSPGVRVKVVRQRH